MAWTDLKAAIAAVIKANGNQEITGTNLRSTLNSLIDQIGTNSQWRGLAYPALNPGTPDGNVFYLATEIGVYSNFSAKEITESGIYVLEYNDDRVWYLTNLMKIYEKGELLTKDNFTDNNKAAFESIDVNDPYVFEKGGLLSSRNGLKGDFKIEFKLNTVLKSDFWIGLTTNQTDTIGYSTSDYLQIHDFAILLNHIGKFQFKKKGDDVRIATFVDSFSDYDKVIVRRVGNQISTEVETNGVVTLIGILDNVTTSDLYLKVWNDPAADRTCEFYSIKILTQNAHSTLMLQELNVPKGVTFVSTPIAGNEEITLKFKDVVNTSLMFGISSNATKDGGYTGAGALSNWDHLIFVNNAGEVYYSKLGLSVTSKKIGGYSNTDELSLIINQDKLVVSKNGIQILEDTFNLSTFYFKYWLDPVSTIDRLSISTSKIFSNTKKYTDNKNIYVHPIRNGQPYMSPKIKGNQTITIKPTDSTSTEIFVGVDSIAVKNKAYLTADILANWDVAVLIRANGDVYISERGSKINEKVATTWAFGDEFSLSVSGGYLKIFKNDTYLFSTTWGDAEYYFKHWMDPASSIDKVFISASVEFPREEKIKEKCFEIVTGALRKLTQVGYTDFNIALPDAGGVYPSFWIRDHAYSLEGSYNYPASDILKQYNYIKSKMATTGDKAFWVPDHINLDGTPVWRAASYDENGGIGIKASLDGAGFLVDIADKYIQLTGDVYFIADNIDFCDSMLQSIMINYLGYQETGSESVVYGFYDSIKPSGYLAFTTLQLFKAYKILNNWAILAGLTRNYPTNEIKEAFNSTFIVNYSDSYINPYSVSYDVNYAYVKCATVVNQQYDVWTSALSVICGILTEKNERLVVASLVKELNNYMKYGMFKHVPDGFYYTPARMWEAYFSEPALGSYQNGGYWLTPAYWIYAAINKYDKIAASKIIEEIKNYSIYYDFCEFVDDSGVLEKTSYVSSAVFTNKILG